jgi:hypothetical protein
MLYPFAFLSEQHHQTAFWILVAAVLLIGFVLNIVGAPLVTNAAPAGIISYELAGDIANAQGILASWDTNARLRAAFVQGFDFLFIPVYVAAIGIDCGISAKQIRKKLWPLASLGTILAWAIILAGIFDIIENIALAIMLLDQAAAPLPQIAFWCAALKFVIIILGISYILYAALVTWMGKVTQN